MTTTVKVAGEGGRQPDSAGNAGGYVGRQEAVAQLFRVLTSGSPSPPMLIQSIEGPGGIGKTALFEHVLRQIDHGARQYLTMKVRGNPSGAGDPFVLAPM